MEYEVGEIFELNGKKYQVIENDKLDCKECVFKDFEPRKNFRCINHFK